jgi:hypothetical protein
MLPAMNVSSIKREHSFFSNTRRAASPRQSDRPAAAAEGSPARYLYD